jgi:HlyD family secretion protein
MATLGTPLRNPQNRSDEHRDLEPASLTQGKDTPPTAMPSPARTITASNWKRWYKPASLVLLAIGVLLYLLRNFLLGTPVATVPVLHGDLVQTIVASGLVATPQRVSIGAEITGRVAAIPVDEGQRVKRGQILIELKDDNERAALAQAVAGIAQASAKLRQLRDVALPAAKQNLRQAQSNLTQARSKFARVIALKAQSFVTQSDVDDAQRNLDVAESQVRAAEIQVQTNQVDGSDYMVAQTTLQQAYANRQVAQALLDATRIPAPVNGILIARSVERGDVAAAGKELMLLAPDGQTQIIVQVDEKNFAQLAMGESAIGSTDAFPDQRFTAKVSYINPGIDSLRGAVEVKLDVAQPPTYLKQDMSATVDIQVARRTATVIVPGSAVRDGDSDKPWVLVVRQQHAQRQQVKLGLRGTGSVEVLDGVAVGERVIPASNTAIVAGRRVRVGTDAKSGGP